MGKKLRKNFFEEWGGKPTTKLLRIRDSMNNSEFLQNRYKLQKLYPNIISPSEHFEQEHPKEADKIYESYVKFLREKTRDRNKFILVFEENCNYGFRRNLLGLKPFGLITSSIAFISIVIQIIIMLVFNDDMIPFELFAISFIIFFIFLIWIFIINSSWVKLAADDYAESLFASIDIIE